MQRSSAVLRSVILMVLIGAGIPLAFSESAVATTPPGQISVSPAVVVEGSIGNTLTFTYAPGAKGLSDGRVSVTIPKGWSPPQENRKRAPGHVTASAGKVSISDQVVTVGSLSLCKTCSLSLTYSDATAPGFSELMRFRTEAAKAGNPLKQLLPAPTVDVGQAPTTAPTISDVFPGAGQLEVEYTSVLADPSVSAYVVTCGSSSVSTSSLIATVTGLTNAVTVPCSVYAQNALGNGPTSPPVSGTPTAGPLEVPTIENVDAGNDELTIYYQSVTADPAVSAYVVTCGSNTVSTLSDPVTITGLANGVTVECTAYAQNSLGDGPTSPPVSGTPTAGPLEPPAITSVLPGNGQLTIDYSASEPKDGPVLGYTATCGSSSTSVDGSTLNITVTGLVNGTLYDSCTVYATDIDGNSATAGWGGIPGPPSDTPVVTSVVPQDGQLTIVYQPVNRFEYPTSYTGTCGDQSETVNGWTTWITISNLSDGTSYSCTVYATNAAGDGPVSVASSGTPTPLSSSPTSSASGVFMAVTCPNTSVCIAVGGGGTDQQSGLIEVSNDGAHTFTDESVPAGTPPLESVTCTSVSDCLAVGGSSVLITSDGGETWQTEYAAGPLASVACVDATHCVAAGWQFASQEGPDVFTSDGGLTWQDANQSFPYGLANVTCLGSNCLGVGPGLAFTQSAGQTWQLTTVAGGTQALDSVACLPSTMTCVAVGTNGEGQFNPNATATAVLSADGGRTWTNIDSSFPAATATVRAISCPSSEICYATGYVKDLGAYTTNGGQTWSTLTGPPNVTPPPDGAGPAGTDFGGDLSCPSSSTCVMVGYNSSGPTAAFTTDGAADWTATTSVG